jgi:hypothetical protein
LKVIIDTERIITERTPSPYNREKYVENKSITHYYLYLNSRALKILCKIHKIDKNLFEYLESIVISFDKAKIRLIAIILIGSLFPEKGKKVINYVFEEEPQFIDVFLYHYGGTYSVEYFLLRELSRLLNPPILKIYLDNKWFFDKYRIYFNSYKNRIHGYFKSFHGSLAYKIQSYDAPERIYEIKDKTQVIKDLTLQDIEDSKPLTITLRSAFRTDKNKKIIKIHDINNKYFFGISYRFYKKTKRMLERIFILENDDYFLSFIRTNTIYFLYIDIPSIEIEILLPARRIKNEGEKNKTN